MIARDLSGRRHAVFRLAPGLLLIFKPHGHREPLHVHEHGQRLRVLRGALRVGLYGRQIILRPGSASLRIAAGRVHETVAVLDTWLLAEAVPRPARPDSAAGRQAPKLRSRPARLSGAHSRVGAKPARARAKNVAQDKRGRG